MSITSDPLKLYSDHNRSYIRFIKFVRYRHGLCAFFRQSDLLQAGKRVLDAGCGSGVVTLGLREALIQRGLTPGPLHAFDLTGAMLDAFRRSLHAQSITGVELAQCDVLQLHNLPKSWKNFDLLVSASMLEYVPRERLSESMSGLRSLLAPTGRFVLFMTRRNLLTRPLIGSWWESNFYNALELRNAFESSGFTDVVFHRFPGLYGYLNLWGYIVTARRS
ncbi:MAG: class I SAM-dependent methyltransferase [Leptospirales bacterium]|nr:class I SAM-dependent methyltransferase [Leptospirales bacterium]